MNPPPPQDPWQETHGPILPPPPPDPPKPGPSSKPPRRPLASLGLARVLFAWSMIVIFMLVTIVANRMVMDLPVDEELLATPGLELKIQSKAAMGMSELFTTQQTSLQEKEAMLDNVWMMVQTPADNIRYVIMTAEVIDADYALGVIESTREEADRFELTDEEFEDMATLENIYLGGAPSNAEDQRLLDRHGWFGELATSYNQPASSSAFTSPRASSKLLVFIFIILFLLAAIVGVAALVLMVLAIVLVASGKIKRRFNAVPTATETPLLVESFAIFMTLFGIGGAAGVYLVSNHGFDPGLITLIVITLCPLLPLCYGIGWRRFRESVGLHTGEGLFKEIGCGILAYLAGLPVVVVCFIVSIVLLMIFPVEVDNPQINPLSGVGGWGLILVVLLIVVWAPLVEELLFRGIFYSHCRRWMPWPVSALIVGIIFAAIHPQWIWFIPGLGAVGFVLAMIREWRDSLVGSITAHALHNGTIACILVTVLLL